MGTLKKIIGKLKKSTSSLEMQSEMQSEFANLYETHLETVLNYCLFRLNNYQLAEDITAEVFERAWRNRESYVSERSGFKTWILTIARNLIIDTLRQEQKRSIVELNGKELDLSQPVEMQLENTEKVSQLLSLIQALDEHEQELITLKFGAGLTNRQIGKVLEKSESAIGTALYRIMRKLRYQWNSLSSGGINEKVQFKQPN